MRAVGMYLKTLRELNKMTQPQLATAISVDVRSIRHWESGKFQPKMSDLVAVLGELRGLWPHVEQLNAEDATIEEAKVLAEAQMQSSPAFIAEIDEVISQLSERQRRLVLDIVREMQGAAEP